MSDNSFVRLAAVNVNEHIEQKGGLSYLSWAWAVDQLLRQDPTANWGYHQPTVFADGTVMVECTVTAFGIPRRMQLPVMDYKNRAIANPDAFAMNTAMQRCLVKAIALHGLGLYIYAGEDLPLAPGAVTDPDPQRPNTATQVAVDAFEAQDSMTKDYILTHVNQIKRTFDAKGDVRAYVEAQRFDTETKLALWSQLPSNIRAAIKKPNAAELGSQP